MARRRMLTGRPLLVATGAALLITTSSAEAPETVVSEVCVETQPADAQVLITGTDEPVAGPCGTVRSAGQVTIAVLAPGYLEQSQVETVTGGPVRFEVALSPAAPPPPLPPVGNLVPPPSLGTVCVTTTPKHAKVQVQGEGMMVQADGPCTDVYSYGMATVVVSAPGFQSSTELVSLAKAKRVKLKVRLDPETKD